MPSTRSPLRPWIARFSAPFAALLLLFTACGSDGPADHGEPQSAVHRTPATLDPPVPRDARVARVVRVSDGDTVVLDGLGRSRLIGIDTPEVYGGVECFGRRASAFVKRLLPPGTRVRYRLGVGERDRYGRPLVYVWLADRRFLNAVLVREGYATPLTIPPNVDYAERFVALARRARERGLGLWRACR